MKPKYLEDGSHELLAKKLEYIRQREEKRRIKTMSGNSRKVAAKREVKTIIALPATSAVSSALQEDEQ